MKVSIGMPIFNGGDILEKRLENILTQTYRDFELIISDNNSTDGTADICHKATQKDKRIKFFRQQSTIPASKNFEFVLKNSSGSYFAWFAHDDYHSPEWLELMVESISRSRGAVLVASDVFEFLDDSFKERVVTDSVREKLSEKELSEKYEIDESIVRRWIHSPNVKGHGFLENSVRCESYFNYFGVKTFYPQEIFRSRLNVYHTYALFDRSAIDEFSFDGTDYAWDHRLVFWLALRGDFVYVEGAPFYKTCSGKIESDRLGTKSLAWEIFNHSILLVSNYRSAGLDLSVFNSIRNCASILWLINKKTIYNCYKKIFFSTGDF